MKFKNKQIREMSEIQLEKTLQDLQGSLRKNRFLAGHGELKKVHQIREIKRSIARIKTEVQARLASESLSKEKHEEKSSAEKKEKVTAE